MLLNDFVPVAYTLGTFAAGYVLYKYFIAFKGEKTMSGFGEIAANGGGFTLFDGRGRFVQAYSRRRDAVRGANRKGITLA